MKIYDKASWHLDAGASEQETLDKFEVIFSLLNSKNMLSEEGKELLELGIDKSISLHDRLLTPEGNTFIDECYDRIINLKSNELEAQLLDLLNEYL